MMGAYLGMILVLVAFSSESRGIVSSRSLAYLLLMLIGESLLTVRAYITGEWPFAVLGGIWAFFAAYSIIKPQNPKTPKPRIYDIGFLKCYDRQKSISMLTILIIVTIIIIYEDI